MRRQRCFSLIELLIVVAIILIIAAIAVPNMFRAKIAANEASAVSSLRAIASAETAYAMAYPTVGYSEDLPSLGGTSCATVSSTAACLIDDTLANATTSATPKSGYYFTYQINSMLGYTVLADPAYWNRSGTKHYYIDGSAVIHYDQNTSGASAQVSDPTIQ